MKNDVNLTSASTQTKDLLVRFLEREGAENIILCISQPATYRTDYFQYTF